MLRGFYLQKPPPLYTFEELEQSKDSKALRIDAVLPFTGLPNHSRHDLPRSVLYKKLLGTRGRY